MAIWVATKILFFKYGVSEEPVAEIQVEDSELGPIPPTQLESGFLVDGQENFLELFKREKKFTSEFQAAQALPNPQNLKTLDPTDRTYARLSIDIRGAKRIHEPGIPTFPKTGNFLTFTFWEDWENNGWDIDVDDKPLKEGNDFLNRFLKHLIHLLYSIVEDPLQKTDKLSILTSKEKKQVLHTFNMTHQSYPRDITVVDLFTQQVQKTPEATALVYENKKLSYIELDAITNQLAHFLRSKGVKKETMVPISLGRSLEMVIGILGILKAGGAYVPIDSEYPLDRINFILNEIEASFILTHQSTSTLVSNMGRVEVLLWENILTHLHLQSKEGLLTQPESNHLAYVIYTSGSTGKPKGVLVEHAQLFFSTFTRNSYYRNLSSILLIPSFSFDASVAALFGSITNGNSLILSSEESIKTPHLLKELLAQTDTLLCVPSYYKFLLDEGLVENSRLRTVIVGGEALDATLVNAHFQHTKEVSLYNEYGPTEATVWSTVCNIRAIETPLTIGNPIANAMIYILDSNGGPVPLEVIGEIYIGGEGIARGYLNEPKLTSKKFLENPFIPSLGGKMYRSGDMGYWLPNGSIVFAGRVDDQVKIQGRRIELGEIEATLLQNEKIKQAVVTSLSMENGINQLIGYVNAEESFNQEEITAYLKSRLPGYMVPASWVQLQKFPLTPNGKIDKKALPLPKLGVDRGKEVPEGPLQQALVAIWKKFLPLDYIGIHDDFFALGGDSLLAMRVISALRKDINIELGLKDFFKHSTIAGLSEHLDTSPLSLGLPSIKRVTNRPAPIPLSFSQESLWLIDQIEGSVAYHLPLVLNCEGILDKKILEKTFQDILIRHEILGTVIRVKDGLTEQIPLHPEKWHLSIIQGEELKDKADLLQNYIQKLIVKPFDLSSDYLFRADLIRLAPDHHVLVLVLHHIAFDAWSTSVLFREIFSLYKQYIGQDSTTLAPLPIQYSDYASWQKEHFGAKFLEKSISYWKKKLEGVEKLQLPSDRLRSPDMSLEGGTSTFFMSKRSLLEIESFSRKEGVTVFMTLLAAFKVLLYRYTSQDDICVGTAVSGRSREETENLVGYFINTLALRSKIEGNISFSGFLDQIKSTTLDALDHQESPFEKVVAEVGAERIRNQNPIFQVMFLLQNVPEVGAADINGLKISHLEVSQHTSKFDLTFTLKETPEGLEGIVEYRTDLFSDNTIDNLIGHYKKLLGSGIMEPGMPIGKLPMLSIKEKEKLLTEYNPIPQPYSKNQTILELLEGQVSKNPESIAAFFGNQSMTYQELDEKSNQLAHLLLSKGVKEEILVLICIERSLEMLVGIWGILKTGAAYVPIDPEYPAERISFIQQDTLASIGVSNKVNSPKLQGIKHLELIDLNWENPVLQNQPIIKVNSSISSQQLAYVIYTSGSTGTPKGVMLEHGNLMAFLSWCKKEFENSRFDLVYASTSICFDLSIFELIYPLTIGKTIRIIENGLRIGDYLSGDTQVLLNTVPSVVQNLIDQEVDLNSVSVLNMAGEPISEKILEKLDPVRMEIRNLYGPTEDTTYSTVYRFDASKKILIGKPIDNTQIYIVSKEGELCPEGVSGEICISGAGLARGYLNREDLNVEKFLPNPFSNDPASRIYWTGDMGRWVEGEIEFHGRKDGQVKIRGYRIELGEIERVLQHFEGIKEAVVLAIADSRGEKQLVGYAVGEKGFDKEVLFDYLGKKLPAYMIPGVWVWMDALPLTPNGKTDRKALPDKDPVGISSKSYTAPGNNTEKELSEIWENVLERERVGIHDNFFDMGGHSLLATRLIAAIRKQMKVEIGIKQLFSFPTVSGMSAQLQLITKSWTLPPILKTVSRPELLPLSYSQESLWFIDQLDGSIQYHLPKVLTLNGELNENALRKALQNVVERHEILRTVIRSTNGRPWQKVRNAENWKLAIIESKDVKGNSNGMKSYIEALISEPFDLANDYMFRANLIRLNSTQNILILVMHHIASDGWSIPILLNELQSFYKAHLKGSPVDLNLHIQYADYALWQKNNLKGEFFDQKVKYWKEQLRDLSPLLLPTDFPRPEVMSNKGAIHSFSIDRDLKDKLLLLGYENGTTLFMTLLSAFKVVLSHFSNQEDICVGTASAGRQHAETENLIGYFINPLPIRTNVEKELPFTALLDQVRLNSLEAFDHQEVPFEKIVATVSSYRDITNNPIFQVMFVLQNLPDISTQELNHLKINVEDIHQTTSKFDLTFILSETHTGLHGTIEYNTELFRGQTMELLAKCFHQTLQTIVLHPTQHIRELDFLSEGKDILYPNQEFAPILDFPEFKPVQDLIQEAVQQYGDKTAVFFRNQKLSYTELNEKANQLAHYLLQKGLLQGQIVGIIMDRSIELIVAILGTLRAGGAYLPIDTDYPPGRVEYMLKDSEAKIHITQREYQKKFKGGSIEIIWENWIMEPVSLSIISPNFSIKPSDPAYIIYTSGSTGQPKGVVIEQQNLFNFLVTVGQKPGISPRDKFLAVSSVSFDIAILETLLPYTLGAQVLMLGKFERKDPQVILETVEREKVSVMFATPTHWKMLLDKGWNKPMPHFNMISGGEALLTTLAEKLLPLGKSLWNIYGPTETTVFSTIKEIKKPGDRVTIGKPILNTNIYILDEKLNPLPVGREGEIFISGAGVARGYLNQSELTDVKFLPDPFHPAGDKRMYKTGDRGKYLPNGEIMILGRKDHQVKLRGYRIELGEIEQALIQTDLFKESIVELKEISRGNPHLVAYVTLSADDPENRTKMEDVEDDLLAFHPTLEEVKNWKRLLSLSLPSYMVPDHYVVMKKFPLTSSGKISRKLLPIPPLRNWESGENLLLAETPEEKLVSDIWCEALGVSQVSITDNFFEIGGHSLFAIQVMTRLEKESGVKLPLSILFRYPTIKKLALVLKLKDGGQKEWNSLVHIKPEGNKPPFYIVHGGGLNVLPFYSIAKNMDADQPVFGLQAKGLNGIEEPLKSIEEIAAHYITEIVMQNPNGPYSLAGYSLGGIIAFEIAKQLKSAGKTVKELIMFDTYVFQADPEKNWADNTLKKVRYNFNKRLFDLYLLWKYPLLLKRLKRESLSRRLSKILLKLKIRQPKVETPILKAIKTIESIQKEAGIKYVLSYYDGPIHLLRAKVPTIYFHDPKYLGWKPFVKQIHIWDMEGEHTTMFSPPNDVKFATVLQEILDTPRT